MKIRKLILTGGLGFLGQQAASAFAEAYPGMRILILEKQRSPFYIRELADNPDIEVVDDIDITSVDSMDTYFRDADAVCHIAAVVSFWRKDKDLINRVNIGGTENVIKLSMKHRLKRMIYVSSTGALGSNNDKDDPVDESFRFDWDGSRDLCYMYSKYQAAERVKAACADGLPGVIANPSSMFGPGNNATVTAQIEKLLAGKVPAAPPGGQAITDVRDTADGLVKLLTKGAAGGNYLLVGGNYTYLEIVKNLAAALDVKAPDKVFSMKLGKIIVPVSSILETLLPVQPPFTKEMAVGGFRFRYYKNKKAIGELGWKPKYSLKDTCRDTVDFYLNHTLKGMQK